MDFTELTYRDFYKLAFEYNTLPSVVKAIYENVRHEWFLNVLKYNEYNVYMSCNSLEEAKQMRKEKYGFIDSESSFIKVGETDYLELLEFYE